jgi:hypothetical protein
VLFITISGGHERARTGEPQAGFQKAGIAAWLPAMCWAYCFWIGISLLAAAQQRGPQTQGQGQCSQARDRAGKNSSGIEQEDENRFVGLGAMVERGRNVPEGLKCCN